jgi:hypothetical protein
MQKLPLPSTLHLSIIHLLATATLVDGVPVRSIPIEHTQHILRTKCWSICDALPAFNAETDQPYPPKSTLSTTLLDSTAE